MSPNNWNTFSTFSDIKNDLISLIASCKDDGSYTVDIAAEKAKGILAKVIEHEEVYTEQFLNEQEMKNRPDADSLAGSR